MTTYQRILSAAETAIPLTDRYKGLQEGITKVFRAGVAAFVWSGKCDLDSDGVRSPAITRYDADHQDQTSIDQDGDWCRSDLVPYIVLPGGWPHGGCELGTLCTVLYNGGHVHAIYADVGPKTKIGEASIAVHQALDGPRVRDGKILNVGIDSGVTFAVYIGQKADYPCTFEEIQAAGEPLMRKVLGLP